MGVCHVSDFYMEGAGDLNSSPHSCAASTYQLSISSALAGCSPAFFSPMFWVTQGSYPLLLYLLKNTLNGFIALRPPVGSWFGLGFLYVVEGVVAGFLSFSSFFFLFFVPPLFNWCEIHVTGNQLFQSTQFGGV